MKYLTDEPIVQQILQQKGYKSLSNNSYKDFYIKLFRLKDRDTFVFKRRGYIKDEAYKFAPKNFKHTKDNNVSDIMPKDIIFNHYPNSSCITDKLNLLDTLTIYYDKNNCLDKLFDIIPITFNLDNKKEAEAYTLYKSLRPEIKWIYKPRYEYGGKSIAFDEPVQLNGVAQEYLQNPTLYNGRKFDIRVFTMMSGYKPDMYIYPILIGRTSSYKFDPTNFDNLYIHITNHVIQKESPEYERYEEGNIVILNLDIIPQIKDIIRDVFNASKKYIGLQKNRYEIFGFDFMLNDSKVKLIEVNENPSLKFDNPEVDNLIVELLSEVIDKKFKRWTKL